MKQFSRKKFLFFSISAPKRGRRTKEQAFTISELQRRDGTSSFVPTTALDDKKLLYCNNGRFREIAPNKNTDNATPLNTVNSTVSVITRTPVQNLIALQNHSQSRLVKLNDAASCRGIREPRSFFQFTTDIPSADIRDLSFRLPPFRQSLNDVHEVSDFRKHATVAWHDDENERYSHFLDDYWRAIHCEGFRVEETICAVMAAVKAIYEEQFTRWNAFMHEAVVQGNVPVINNNIPGPCKLRCGLGSFRS